MTGGGIARRALGLGTAGLLAAPRLAAAQAPRVLKVIPRGDLPVLDPLWTTAYQTRDHAYLVFDTLFGLDAAFRPQPQMLASATTEEEGRLWTLRLRPGLRFHDNEPVLARDCVASIRRWAARDAFGQTLMAATEELSAPDDATIGFRLRQPFPMLPYALGKASPNICVIMPERLARTDPFTRVNEMVGSGPFRFLASEQVPGAFIAYSRFEGYVPREGGTPEWTSGPKRVEIDRLEMHVIPDSGTAAAALQSGEVDWWAWPEADLLPVLRRARGIELREADPMGLIGTLRLNHLAPPFDKPAIRRAVLGAVSQADFMAAVAGTDRAYWRDGVGFFAPASPLASTAGMDAMTGDIEAGRRALREAGYAGEPVVLLGSSNIAILKAVSDVAADLFRRLGLNVDYQVMDWGTVVQRRVRKEPPGQGGWSAFGTFWSGLDHLDPAVHAFLRGNGAQAAPGWPDSSRIEALRTEWLATADPAAQARMGEAIQRQAFEDVPYIPLGQQRSITAYRRNVSGILDGVPVYWNVRRI
ncbi:ABC transporter substrate-binding protein [Belnapia sp. T6]|uniref:ABC transporter substrate-binding protein n=2 Tax=Belnapia mucosa TaxID=2804532 RepID=A0ABS1UZ53_9PROT|nr:ABC transporter substrate-binding protein [Belnapia mucosa]